MCEADLSSADQVVIFKGDFACLQAINLTAFTTGDLVFMGGKNFFPVGVSSQENVVRWNSLLLILLFLLFVHKCIFSPNCSVPFTCKNKVSIWRKMLLWEEKHDFVFLTNFQPFPASNEAASKDYLSSKPSPTTLMSEVSSCQYNNTK